MSNDKQKQIENCHKESKPIALTGTYQYDRFFPHFFFFDNKNNKLFIIIKNIMYEDDGIVGAKNK